MTTKLPPLGFLPAAYRFIHISTCSSFLNGLWGVRYCSLCLTHSRTLGGPVGIKIPWCGICGLLDKASVMKPGKVRASYDLLWPPPSPHVLCGWPAFWKTMSHRYNGWVMHSMRANAAWFGFIAADYWQLLTQKSVDRLWFLLNWGADKVIHYIV